MGVRAPLFRNTQLGYVHTTVFDAEWTRFFRLPFFGKGIPRASIEYMWFSIQRHGFQRMVMSIIDTETA